jgi:tetratricopeptide (TPR) repeat protein
MSTLSSLSLPPPRNWQDFEDLCCDLWRRLWSDPDTQKNGRNGQAQSGVDVFGRPGRGIDYAGVQCKLKGTANLTREEIEIEVERASIFKPHLSHFSIATTAPRDVTVQEAVRQITVAQLKKGAFPLSVVFWEDILLSLSSFPDLITKYFSLVTVVQKVGDGYEPVPGYAHLTLTRFLNARVSPDKTVGLDEAGELLSPYAASVPLIGRESTLSDLWTWMQSGRPISVRVLTAKAGTGKTRLAIHLCDAAAQAGWYAGFLRESELVRFRNLQNTSTWGWSRPTLIVVDYAASLTNLLRDWLVELADQSGRYVHPLRLILLERHADPRGGWWREVFGSGAWKDDMLQSLLDPRSGPYTLSPLIDSEQRHAVLISMLERTGSPIRPPLLGTSREFERRLADITWGGEPLFLLMAGLVAARAGFGEVLSLSATDLAFRIASHEVYRINEIARVRRIPEVLLAHLAAYVTLCQGMTRKEAEELVENEAIALGCRVDGGPLGVVDALMAALPDEQGGIAPVLPDVIGEAVILNVLGGGVPEKALAAVSRATRRLQDRTTASLVRLAQDYAAVRMEPLLWFDWLTEEVIDDFESLMDLLKQLPYKTLALRKPAAALTKRAVEFARAQEDPEFLGFLLRSWSHFLGELGDPESALAASQEALQIYRELYTVRPNDDDVRHSLAFTLNGLAIRFKDLGLLEESLATIEEGTDLYRELVKVNPDVFRRFLAMFLHNLGNALKALGREKDALKALEEAVIFGRELTQGPSSNRIDSALALISLANLLNDLGRREESLGAIEEAVGQLRGLAAILPDAFYPELSLALDNLSHILCTLDRPGDALAASEQAVEFYRKSVMMYPTAFAPYLAHALNNLSLPLIALGRQEEALTASEEAVRMYRKLALEHPGTFLRDLANTLDTMALSLTALGRRKEALMASREAVQTFTPYFLAHPGCYLKELSPVIKNYIKFSKEAGCEPDALLLEPLQTVTVCHCSAD